MKPERFVVGLTGGIGTGKSSALEDFAALGAATVSLDQIAREQARPGREGHRAIVRAFGRGVLGPGGAIDRRALGVRVFKDKAALRRLENATHPGILREMKRLVGRLRGLVVVDVPLLFEKNLQSRFDATILIASSAAAQRRRVMRRDKLSPGEARRRISAQWPLARKRALADLTIDNDGTKDALTERVRGVHAGLSLLYGGTTNGN